jgi:three-Cys-motif partner protein
MGSTRATVWKCDRGTRAKLEVLQRYLGAWLNILAVHGSQDVIYFDSFCGPGEYEDGTRGSPVLAAQLANAAVQKFANLRVHIICVDKKAATIRYLRNLKTIQNHHPKVLIDIRVGEFAREITEIVDSSQYDKRWPIFSFVDPFGFSDFSFSTLQTLMRNQSSEIFVNLFCGFMNRFATHPDEQVRQAIRGLIGSENLERVTTASDGITEICEIFGEKLKTIGPHVRRFMMRDENNTRDNALFFCGRHERGLEKIKEAMWKVDPVSGATFSEYSARKSETAPSLLGFQERQTSPLRRSLVEHFAGQAVTVSKLKEWVIIKTETFLPMHLRIELEELHKAGRITYVDPSPAGRKRRSGDWPDRLQITFRSENV